MFMKIVARLWNDESGAVVAAEYLMLGSVVAVGGVSGMVAMRDGIVDEYKEYGASIRETRQAHTIPAPAARPATAAPTTPTTFAPQVVTGYTFAAP